MRRISRMILVTAGYNFRMWKKNMRVIAAFLLAFILCFMLTDKLVLFAGKQETTNEKMHRHLRFCFFSIPSHLYGHKLI